MPAPPAGARTRACRPQRLGLLLRGHRHRKILPRVRQAQACRRRLDLFLRHGEQGQVLR